MGQSALLGNSDVLNVGDRPVKMVRFSASGQLMATGDIDVVVKIWKGSELLTTIDPKSHDEKIRPTENIRSIEFSPDGNILYVIAADTVNAYDVATSELIWQYRPPRFLAFLIVSPQALCVAPDGSLGVSFDYGSIARFEPDGRIVYRKQENYSPRRMGFSPKGIALVGSDGFNLCVWRSQDGQLLHRWPIDQKIYALDVSKSEPLVVTRELRTLSIWDIENFQKLCELPAGRGLPTVAFSPVDRIIASGERTRIRLINLECKAVRDLECESDILNLAFEPSGTRIAAGCSDGKVHFWNL